MKTNERRREVMSTIRFFALAALILAISITAVVVTIKTYAIKEMREVGAKIKAYGEKRKKIEEQYYERMMTARMRFGLNELSPDSFKTMARSVFGASFLLLIYYLKPTEESRNSVKTEDKNIKYFYWKAVCCICTACIPILGVIVRNVLY